MKAKLLLLLLIGSLTVQAENRRIEWPDTKHVRQHVFAVSAVELTDSATIVEMIVRERKNSWYMVGDDILLRDPQGKIYPIQRYESPYGTRFGRRLRPRQNGEGWLKLYFPPLPAGTEWFDYTGKKETSYAIKGIRLDTLTWAGIWRAEQQRLWDELYATANEHRLETNQKNLKGKWKCSSDFTHNIGIGYYFPHLSGHYKFRDNGTFTARFDGVSRYSYRDEVFSGAHLVKLSNNVAKGVYIKVKGTYTIKNGAISTTVNPDEVKCFFDQGRLHPDMEDPDLQQHEMRWRDMKVDFYEQREKTYARMGETIKAELLPLWTWQNEPIVITKTNLLVGRKAVFSR